MSTTSSSKSCNNNLSLTSKFSKMGNPHIVVIPYPAHGHVIPLMELSKSLSEYGFKITFVNTGYSHELLSEYSSTGDEISLVSILDDTPNSSKTVLKVLPGKIEELIERISASNNGKISCILADQSIGWVLEIAKKKGIRRAAFCPAAAAQLVLGFHIPKLIEDGIIDNEGTPLKRQIIKLSPTMPEMNTENFVWACIGNKESQKIIFDLMVRNNKSIKLTDWLLCNSTYDLESAAFTIAPQILPIGPLFASTTATNLSPEDTDCLKWLDQQLPQSVMYIAFGSTSVFSSNQIQELALGLELTNRPFLWASGCKTKDAFIEEFRHRIGERGKIVCWAPQQRILAHPSVACFVSHCGWNSIMEGVSNGIVFLCWPYFADQFFNKSYICEIWKTGLALSRDENGMITGSEIKSKLEQVLSNGEFKARALELKEMVLNSVKEGGTSYQNFKKFVEWIEA